MISIFAGAVFLFLDITINIDEYMTIGIIPDFIGYILLWRGLKALSGESDYFKKIKPLAVVMIPISGFDWVYNILREYLFIGNFYAFREEIVVSLPENILQIIPLVLFYFVIGGIKQMEWKYKANFEGEKVEKAWLIMTVIQIAACGASILAGFVFLVPVALLIYIACIISGIYFLIILNRCKGLCEPVLKE